MIALTERWLATDARSPGGGFEISVRPGRTPPIANMTRARDPMPMTAFVSIVETTSGEEVFDAGAYSTSPHFPLKVGWRSGTADELWVCAGANPALRIARTAAGTWARAEVTADLPAQVRGWLASRPVHK
ncbi:hypothetical protein JK358_37555 [Nocardia sp. 2]|uniref:Uncharacterized protein n=1 Tax=Nocardia acididurans TaxID=2802282 RepID=A0ABS1MHM0_9NOCA|nr:hypothetical protein [Nocardia acididurans]MBL1080117.1 hypothetical protein [Nocardia acididurans]